MVSVELMLPYADQKLDNCIWYPLKWCYLTLVRKQIPIWYPLILDKISVDCASYMTLIVYGIRWNDVTLCWSESRFLYSIQWFCTNFLWTAPAMRGAAAPAMRGAVRKMCVNSCPRVKRASIFLVTAIVARSHTHSHSIPQCRSRQPGRVARLTLPK